MPALPSVSKVIRVDLLQTYLGNTNIIDRIFFQYSGTVSTTDLTTVLGTISSAWLTNLVRDYSTGHTLTGIRGTDLNSNTGAQVQITTSRVGTDAGPGLPAGAAVVVRFKLALRYRGGHPRFYSTGKTTAWESASTAVDPTHATQLSGDFAAFITASITTPPAAVGTLSHVNVSYFSGFHNVTLPNLRVKSVPTLRGTPVVSAISSYSTNPKMASQRRRNVQSA